MDEVGVEDGYLRWPVMGWTASEATQADPTRGGGHGTRETLCGRGPLMKEG